MSEFLNSLEPRIELAGSIIFKELDDFTEVLFFNKGTVAIGFNINHKSIFCLQKSKEIVIADSGCTFNHKCNFIYKCIRELTGVSIAKNCWRRILVKYPQIST